MMPVEGILADVCSRRLIGLLALFLFGLAGVAMAFVDIFCDFCHV